MSPCAYTTKEISLTLCMLDTEINVRFILNEHGDTHILLHEFKLHEVIYNISRFEEKFKKRIAVKNTCLGSAGYLCTQLIPKFLI